jgi:ribosomal protein S18 acetylase RimI-like enzyme
MTHTAHSTSGLPAETVYAQDRSHAADVLAHLRACDSRFVPPLCGRVDLNAYAHKIARHASRSEAWQGDALVGLVAIYANDFERRIAHVTSVSVLATHGGQGIAARLLSLGLAQARALGMRHATLEVARDNTPALRLYETFGFAQQNAQGADTNWCTMTLDLTTTTAARGTR